MGISFSCCFNSSKPLDCARIIHINGYIQDFSCPITVAQITGKPSKHVLCTSTQLLTIGSRPLRPEDPLESGRVYFLLPHSAFQSDSSPVDLASLVTRLTAAAKRAGPADPIKVGPLSGLDVKEEIVWLKSRTWKPALETIGEVSFRGRESMVSFGSVGEIGESVARVM